jgi:hypothetical protein
LLCVQILQVCPSSSVDETHEGTGTSVYYKTCSCSTRPYEETFVSHQQTIGPYEETVVAYQQTIGPYEETVVSYKQTSVSYQQTIGPYEGTVMADEEDEEDEEVEVGLKQGVKWEGIAKALV